MFAGRLIAAASLAGLAACSSGGLPDFTELVEDVAPAVVGISGKRAPEAPAGTAPSHPFERWFRDFFGAPESDPAPLPGDQALGSGFIVHADGEILTNYHVVRDADEIVVRLADRRQYTARLVGADEYSDLALLRIEADDLPVVTLGESAPLKVGEWVLAIGSPFGFAHSVTAGIVSAKGRSLQGERYVPFIQTDVAINPGNSGGPLFDLDGRVVGVNSQIYSRTGGYMGLSFAIPIDTAVRVVDQLRRHGEVRRGWLGVEIQEVDQDLARSFGLSRAQGALVSRVIADTPAARAGLQSGDIILAVNGRAVPSSAALPPLIGSLDPGSAAKLKILRDGRRQTLRVTLDVLRGDGRDRAAAGLGLELAELSEGRAGELGIAGGLVVRELGDGPAQEAGLRVGDVIERLGGAPVPTVEAFEQRLAQLKPGESAALLVHRGEQSQFLVLTVPQP